MGRAGESFMLGIESTFDDACVAAVTGGRLCLAEERVSVGALHQAKYGGVQPLQAAFAHQESLPRLVSSVMERVER